MQNSFLGRVDWQLRQGDHITSRVSYWDWDNPFTQVDGTEHPSQAAARSRKAFNVANTWANVINDTTIQEVRSATATSTGRTRWPNRPWPTRPTTCSRA